MPRSHRRPFRSAAVRFGLVAIVLLSVLGVRSALADTSVLDDFAYASDTEARAAWLARGTSPKVAMAESGPWGAERVMTLPCNFSALPDRCYWDRLDTFDLSGYPMFALELFVPDPDAVSQFTLYFHSGAGWYSQSHDITRSGWQTLTFAVTDFSESGTPGGWDQVDTIRLSPWRGSEHDTELAVRELRAYSPLVFILRDEVTASPSGERSAELIRFLLGEYDVSLGVFDGSAVDDGYLAGSKLLVLPYNEIVSDPQMTAIENFVASGGKLMAFYLLSDRLETLLGIERTGSTVGDYAAFAFDDAVIGQLPERARQDSWTITNAVPRAVLHARVIAEWEDSAGVPTGDAAWLASDTGSFMSHILHPSDRLNKQKTLLALIGHDVPEIWPGVAGAAIARIGTIAEYADYDEAVADIRDRAASTPRQAEVETALVAADTARDQAIAEAGLAQFSDAAWTAIDARSHLQHAYALCQSSVLPEFRAVWEHSGTGPQPGDWPAAIESLADHGFSAVFPNSLKAGLAHYDSALLPHSSQFDSYGDQVAAVVDAAHARGIEVHVWKVNWNLTRAPRSFIDQMHAEDRTQVSADGAPIDWLCPSHPDNHALERDSMLEVLQNYDIDGLHFDYIRYPGPDYCYCDGCRTRFEQETGNTVSVWPDDVRAGGPLEAEFLPWRRLQITELVEAVHDGAAALDPDVRISAAVYGDYSQAFGNVGQDWVDWIGRGIVDFLNPMSTTPDHDRFRELVTEQIALAAGRVPTYPGIGVSNDATHLTPDDSIAQVLITREAGTGGFIMFAFDRDLELVTLPALALGTTLPGGVADTPDGDLVPGTMLHLAKSGPDLLELSWGASCDSAPGPTEYAVYRGSLRTAGEWNWDHRPVTCGTGGATFDTIPAEPGDHYFLVVPTDTNQEGGYGSDSSGDPRPAAATPCHPQTRVACP